MPEPPAIDGSRIGPMVEDVVLFSYPRPVGVQGESGAATPGSLVRAVNLDGTAPPIEARARQDGSFVLAVLASVGDELRFDAVIGSERSEPVDVLLATGDTLDVFVPSPRHECVRVEPGFQIPLPQSGGARLLVTNDCTDVITLSAPRFRLGTPGASGFEILTALPLAIALGSSTSIALDSTQGSAPEEDVLFLDVTLQGTILRYPFGLYATD